MPPAFGHRRRVAALATAGLVLAVGYGLFSLLHHSGLFSRNVSCRSYDMWQGPTGDITPGGWGSNIASPVHVRFNRSGGTLVSADVTTVRDLANHDIEVDVLHRPSACSMRYSTVFRSRFAATSPTSRWIGSTRGIYRGPSGPSYGHPAGRLPSLSTWSGTLSPKDWRGGCQGGLYKIFVIWTRGRAGSHAYGADDVYDYGEEEFSCR